MGVRHSKFKKTNLKIHSGVGEDGGAEVAIGTRCNDPVSVLLYD